MSDEDVLQMNEEDDLQLYHQATHMNDEDVLQLFKFADQVLGGANYNWQSIEDNTDLRSSCGDGSNSAERNPVQANVLRKNSKTIRVFDETNGSLTCKICREALMIGKTKAETHLKSMGHAMNICQEILDQKNVTFNDFLTDESTRTERKHSIHSLFLQLYPGERTLELKEIIRNRLDKHPPKIRCDLLDILWRVWNVMKRIDLNDARVRRCLQYFELPKYSKKGRIIDHMPEHLRDDLPKQLQQAFDYLDRLNSDVLRKFIFKRLQLDLSCSPSMAPQPRAGPVQRHVQLASMDSLASVDVDNAWGERNSPEPRLMHSCWHQAPPQHRPSRVAPHRTSTEKDPLVFELHADDLVRTLMTHISLSREGCDRLEHAQFKLHELLDSPEISVLKHLMGEDVNTFRCWRKGALANAGSKPSRGELQRWAVQYAVYLSLRDPESADHHGDTSIQSFAPKDVKLLQQWTRHRIRLAEVASDADLSHVEEKRRQQQREFEQELRSRLRPELRQSIRVVYLNYSPLVMCCEWSRPADCTLMLPEEIMNICGEFAGRRVLGVQGSRAGPRIDGFTFQLSVVGSLRLGSHLRLTMGPAHEAPHESKQLLNKRFDFRREQDGMKPQQGVNASQPERTLLDDTFIDRTFEGDDAIYMNGIDFATADRAERRKIVGNVGHHFVRPHDCGMSNAIPSGTNHVHVMQRNLGDCWLLSAVLLLDFHKRLKEKVICRPAGPDRPWCVNLCCNGEWLELQLDDRLPCIIPGPEGTPIPAFALGPLWLCLVQKAFAKMYKSYESLESGSPDEALETLTGYPCSRIMLHGATAMSGSQDVADLDNQWKELESSLLKGFLCVATMDGSNTAKAKDKQLVAKHSYSVLNVANDREGRRVELRDPWGVCPGGNTSSTNRTDGSFFLTFDEFVKSFAFVDVCRVQPDWWVARMTGSLPSLTSTQSEAADAYELDLAVASEVELSLIQRNGRGNSNFHLSDLCICLLRRKDGDSPLELVASSHRLLKPSVHLMIKLDAGKYVILPLSFRLIAPEHQSDRSYVIRIGSSEEPRCHQTQLGVSEVTNAIGLHVKRNGVQTGQSTKYLIKLYELKDMCGNLFYVENHGSEFFLCNVDLSESKECQSSRGKLLSRDVIPPASGQLLHVLTKDSEQATPYWLFKINGLSVDEAASIHSPYPILVENTASVEAHVKFWDDEECEEKNTKRQKLTSTRTEGQVESAQVEEGEYEMGQRFRFATRGFIVSVQEHASAMCLNIRPPFRESSKTTECVAKWLYKLCSSLNNKHPDDLESPQNWRIYLGGVALCLNVVLLLLLGTLLALIIWIVPFGQPHIPSPPSITLLHSPPPPPSKQPPTPYPTGGELSRIPPESRSTNGADIDMEFQFLSNDTSIMATRCSSNYVELCSIAHAKNITEKVVGDLRGVNTSYGTVQRVLEDVKLGLYDRNFSFRPVVMDSSGIIIAIGQMYGVAADAVCPLVKGTGYCGQTTIINKSFEEVAFWQSNVPHTNIWSNIREAASKSGDGHFLFQGYDSHHKRVVSHVGFIREVPTPAYPRSSEVYVMSSYSDERFGGAAAEEHCNPEYATLCSVDTSRKMMGTIMGDFLLAGRQGVSQVLRRITDMSYNKHTGMDPQGVGFYPFVYTVERSTVYCQAHGARPHLVGHNLTAIFESDELGNSSAASRLNDMFVQAAKAGGGYVKYTWSNSGEKDRYTKVALIGAVRNSGILYFIGVGFRHQRAPLRSGPHCSECKQDYIIPCAWTNALALLGHVQTLLLTSTADNLQADFWKISLDDEYSGRNARRDSNITSNWLYAFIYDFNGTCVAHGANPERVPNAAQLSRELNDRFVEKAKLGGGWIAYMWKNEEDELNYTKIAYVTHIHVDGSDFYVGVGLGGKSWDRHAQEHGESLTQWRESCSSDYQHPCAEDWVHHLVGKWMERVQTAKSHSALQALLGPHSNSQETPFGFEVQIFNSSRVVYDGHDPSAIGMPTLKWLYDLGIADSVDEWQCEDPSGHWHGPKAIRQRLDGPRSPRFIYCIVISVDDVLADGLEDGRSDRYTIMMSVSAEAPLPPFKWNDICKSQMSRAEPKCLTDSTAFDSLCAASGADRTICNISEVSDSVWATLPSSSSSSCQKSITIRDSTYCTCKDGFNSKYVQMGPLGAAESIVSNKAFASEAQCHKEDRAMNAQCGPGSACWHLQHHHALVCLEPNAPTSEWWHPVLLAFASTALCLMFLPLLWGCFSAYFPVVGPK